MANVKEIIDYTRREILNDYKVPYKWRDEELIVDLNRSYREFCKDTKIIIDSSTVSVCQINLLANQLLHDLSPYVVKVYSGRLNSNGYPLNLRTSAYMELNYFNWQNTSGTSPLYIVTGVESKKIGLFPKYNTTGYVAGSSDIQFVAATKKITQAGGTFTDHFAEDDSFIVDGTTSNDGIYTVVSVVDTEIVVSETLVNESNTSAILKLIKNIALLRVARLPLVTYTANDLALATPPTPEIDSQYHYDLPDGIVKFAFLRQHSETYDPNKASRHAGIFQTSKDKAEFEISSQNEDDQSNFTPHPGMM